MSYSSNHGRLSDTYCGADSDHPVRASMARMTGTGREAMAMEALLGVLNAETDAETGELLRGQLSLARISAAEAAFCEAID